MDHLSSMDASFLHVETPETPMHVGSLMLVELPLGYKGDYYEEVKDMIGRRMHLSAVLARKLAPMPFELAEPVWIEDDDIDLDYHIRSLTLRRPGTMADLEQLVARLHSSLLDRSRPLWEMYVIEGLENGRVAFYTKVHHSGVDGKSGTEMAKVMYDISPKIREVSPPRRKASSSSSGYQLGVAELMQAAVANTAAQYRKLAILLPTAAKALTTASKLLAGQQKTGKGERALNLGLAPKTIFNDSITNQRSYSTLTLPFDEMKALGQRVGGTVNTVVMAMCSGALQRFLSQRNLLPKEALIAAVPVSLRAEGDDSMNNQVSMVRVDLATDITDMAERFKAIHASSEAAKAVVRELKPILGVDMPITGSPWLMTSMASLYGRSKLARQIPPMANVTISNVPGPQVQLYLGGAKMTSFYPVSIPYHGSALNITVQSYAGQLDFGFIACRRILSQEESYELVAHMRSALEEIQRLPSVVDASASTTAPAVGITNSSNRRTGAAPAKVAATARKPTGGKKRAASTQQAS